MPQLNPIRSQLNGFGHRLAAAARREWPALLCALTFIAGVQAFMALADEVVERETRRFDRALLLALRNTENLSDPLGPGWLEEMGRDFTALGSAAVLTLVAVGAVLYMLLSRQFRTALFTVIAVGGGWIVSSGLKLGYDRARPDLVAHGDIVYTASFPSGHATMSAVTYLTLAAILCRVERRWRLRLFLLAAAVFLTVLIGLTRVYLGVHWPTDVLAGWSVGAAWAALCWVVARGMQLRVRSARL